MPQTTQTTTMTTLGSPSPGDRFGIDVGISGATGIKTSGATFGEV